MAVKKMESKHQGEEWIGASGTRYTAPKINADTLRDILENNYISENLERLQSLLFSDYYEIKVYPPHADGKKDEERDKDLEEILFAMMEGPDIRLWDRMRQAWKDIYAWGCALINPVWTVNKGERRLTALRRLDPYSFRNYDKFEDYIYSQILRGISLDASGNMVFTQTQTGDKKVVLTNVTLMKDPVDTELAGTSKLIPMVPLISMLNFAWQAEIQRANRVGAPILFIRFTKPAVVNSKRDDYKRAYTILQNWGKNTAYMLEDNMEVVKLEFPDNATAKDIITMIQNRILEYFSPTTLIKKQGETLGGNASAEVDLLKMWEKGEHRKIESLFQTFLQEWLDTNGYEGYVAYLDIPEPRPDRADWLAAQAQTGYNTRSMTLNEIRRNLGLEPLTPEEEDALVEYYSKINQPQMMGLGFGNAPKPEYPEEGQDEEDPEPGDDSKNLSQNMDPHRKEAGDDLEYLLQRTVNRLEKKVIAVAKSEDKKTKVE